MIKLPALIELDGFIGNAPYNVRFTCTDSGYITPTIACSGADIYLDGVLAGSVDPLGAELLSNNQFENWTGDDPDGWTVAEVGDITSKITENPSNQCQFISDGTGLSMSQAAILTSGKIYRQVVVVTAAASGSIKIGHNVDSDAFGVFDTFGTISSHIVGGGDGRYEIGRSVGGCDVTIDSVSAKLVGETSLYVTKGQTVDFVFSDPSSVTYIDMRGDSLQGDASQFGQFSNLDELYYPDMEYKGFLSGTELMVNYDFATGDTTGWTDLLAGGSTFAVSDTTATLTRGTSDAYTYQNKVTAGVTYKIQVHVSATSGTLVSVFNLNTAEILIDISSLGAGVHAVEYFATGSHNIGLRCGSNSSSVAIDYFSVKKVTGQSDTQLLSNNAYPSDLTGWVQTDVGWAATGGAFVCTADGVTQLLGTDLTDAPSLSNVYEFRYLVTQNSLATAGEFKLASTGMGDETVAIPETIGTHTVEIWCRDATAATDLRVFVSSAVASGTITIPYFSIKAIASELVNGGFDDFTGDYPDDWGHSTNAGDGSSEITEVDPGEGYGGVGTGAVNIKSTGTLATIFQSTAMTVGSQYRTTYSATNVVSGVARCEFGGTNFTVSATGDFLHYNTATSAVYALARNAACDITFDNALVLPWPAQNIGNIASLITPTIEVLYIDAASNIAWTDGAFDNELAMTNITLDAVNWTVTEVNAFFASLVVANDAGAVDCVVTLLNMIAPTGQGDTDATALAADGWTVTVNGSAY